MPFLLVFDFAAAGVALLQSGPCTRAILTLVRRTFSPASAAPWLLPPLAPVVHEDVAFQKGVDVHAAKMEIKREVEKMGGRLPAEHGHGTEYVAPKETQARWMAMDPTNVFNPGVGGLSTCSHYQCAHAGSDGDGGGH
jgi:FAD/FMN-containing dehydrogenase